MFTNAYDLNTDPENDLPFSTDPQPLGELLERSTLPIVVKVPSENKVHTFSKEGGFNFHQPLFLHKELDGAKVYARCLSNGKNDDKSLEEYGPFVVIPADYQGWFQIADIEDDGPMRRMSSVARVFPTKILSTKPTYGYHIRDANNKLYEKRISHPGIYQVHDVFEDNLKFTDERKVVRKKAMRCLRCTLDGKSDDVLFPLDTEGTFYIARARKTGGRQSQTDNFAAVYKIRDILTLEPLKQLTICLIYGKPPKQHEKFSRFMKMRQLVKEHTVVGCNLIGSEMKLFELPVMARPLYVKCDDDTSLELDDGFIAARTFCDERYVAYTQEIKIRHGYKIEGDEEKTPDGRISVVDRSKTAISQSRNDD